VNDRRLSDADVAAIADALEKRLANTLLTNAGKGVLRLAWHGLLLVIIGLAAFGITHQVVNR